AYSDSQTFCHNQGIAVLDLETRDKRLFPDPLSEVGEEPEGDDDVNLCGPDLFGIGDITWAPDARRLAFSDDPNGDAVLHVLDTAAAADLADATAVDPTHAYNHPEWVADGRIVAEAMGADNGAGSHPEDEGGIFAVDPATGFRERILPGIDHAYDIDADITGRHLIVTDTRHSRTFTRATIEGMDVETIEGPALADVDW
ncbi:MAG: hypothetical protein ACRDY7_16135, partial [Acidimicrobiia bacterium]